MKKDQIIELEITDMTDDGRAFGRCEGCAVFVSGGCSFGDARIAGAVPGDTIKARVTKAGRSSAEAVLTELSVPSADRIEAACPYYADCGGCSLQELAYDAQKKLKTAQVKQKLERLGRLESPVLREMTGANALKYYRSKAVFAVGPHGEVGFLKRKSHHVLDIDDCMLQSDAAMVCADALRRFLKEHRDAASVISQLTVRTAFSTGEVMAVLELADGGRRKGGDIPHVEELIALLDDAVYSLDPDAGSREDSEPFYSLESVAIVHKGRCRIAAGRPTITEELLRPNGGSISYEISPQSFFQVNPEQMVKLYDKACEYAALKGGETVLDLYCGAGTIGIWLLEELRSRDEEAFGRTRVIGIESVKPAVIDANRNSVINGLVNTRYICGKAEEELPGMMGLSKLYKWNEVNERVEREPEIKIGMDRDSARAGGQRGENRDNARAGGQRGENRDNARAGELQIEKVDVIVLDPPRAGCAEPLLAAAVQAAPDRIVYVSCDPGTLARDIQYLTAHGYEFIEATPIDQFPWTTHIEVVARIQKMKS